MKSRTKTKYCLPLQSTSKRQLLQTIEEHTEAYDLFEIWADYLEDASPDFGRAIADDLPGRCIFVLRHQKFEETRLQFETRKAWIATLSGASAIVDLDVTHQKKEIEWLRSQHDKIPLITSFHNYEGTPRRERLVEIVNEMSLSTPYVVKLSTFCNSPADALTLLHVGLDLKRHGMHPVVVGMGDFGTPTRVYGALWYNEFTYAPYDEKLRNAPGQLTRDAFENVFRALEGHVG